MMNLCLLPVQQNSTRDALSAFRGKHAHAPGSWLADVVCLRYIYCMKHIPDVGALMRSARLGAGLSQADFAAAAGTTQSAIARLEQPQSNPTIATLVRSAAAAGYRVEISLVPAPPVDAVIERYKLDVDRTLLRENLRRSHDERVRSLGEWQLSLRTLAAATAAARMKPRR